MTTPVLVMSDHAGVFAGLIADGADWSADIIELTECRMAVAWGTDTGIMGLANPGPDPKIRPCRISKAADQVSFRDVIGVVEITPAAWQRWQAEPWTGTPKRGARG